MLLQVALKRDCKREDAAWVRANREVVPEPLEAAKESKNFLQDWLWEGSLEEWLTKQEALEAEGRGDPFFCMARTWGGGWGGRCLIPHLPGTEYCEAHRAQVASQGYLTHGRVDGPVPPKKLKEFEATQRKLRASTSTSPPRGANLDFESIRQGHQHEIPVRMIRDNSHNHWPCHQNTSSCNMLTGLQDHLLNLILGDVILRSCYAKRCP